MNHEIFGLAVDAALSIPVSGIGTLSEKKVHSALKYYVQPDPDMHEIRTDGFICDAVSESTVFEIQSRTFSKLKPKLQALLPSHVVTVVYPVITEKVIYSTDIETGEVTVRKSPKSCSVCDAFYELCSIRDFLNDKNLRLRFICITAEEHRICKIRKLKNGRKKSEVLSSDRIPVRLIDDITVNNTEEYIKIIPKGLSRNFSVKEFAKAAGLYGMNAGRAVFTLCCAGVAERCGKEGRSYVYTIKAPEYYKENTGM